MFRKYALPLLSIAGLAFALITAVRGSAPIPAAPPVSPPASPPFESYVAGVGLVEASSENIAIGTPVPGIVDKVFVQAGDSVEAGAPLFRIEHRSLDAERKLRAAALQTAKAKLGKLSSLPRPEEIPTAQAKAREAQSVLGDIRAQLERWESLPDKRAVSEEELVRKRFAVQTAEAKFQAAEAELALLRAGSWAPDLEIAKAEIAQAEASLQAVEIEIERHIVRSPIAGNVLQMKVRPGEYASASSSSTPLLLLGAADPLHIRVDVDENEAWRVLAKSKAVAFVRGNRDLKVDLEFVRIEPYVIPKKSLSGESTERVDTRVLQALFRFSKGDLPVYVGQQMDVFIEAPGVKR